MSVRSLIAVPEVQERLGGILPPLAKLPNLALRVSPRTARYGLVGTAFDYALRFELLRRNPHAVTRSWVAEGAVERIAEAAERAGLPKKQARLLEKQGAGILEDARRFVEGFCASSIPDLAPLAVHALLLAKLDNVYRAYQLDSALTEADPEDVRDVTELLAIVPYDALSDASAMLLNPTFGSFSTVVGGADADLISGDLLVELKTTKTADLKREMVRQLLVYFILAQRAQAEDRMFPEVRRFGVYFSRHGHLWERPIGSITGHPRYRETEDWLIRFAADTELAPELRELWTMMQEDEPGAGPTRTKRRSPAAKKKVGARRR